MLACLPTLYCSDEAPTESQPATTDVEVVSQPPDPSCGEIPGFIQQLDAIGQRVDALWIPPSDPSLAIDGEFRVLVRFSINPDGTLRDVTVPGDEPEALKASVLEAARQAPPTPLPPELACMSTVDDLSMQLMRRADAAKP